MSFPYLARTTLKYKSPHATDLSFAKDETIRVTGPSDDDEDWLVGESLDGSKSGGFPKDFIIAIEPESAESGTSAPASVTQAEAKEEVKPVEKEQAPVPISAPSPPSPKVEPAELPKPTPEPTAPSAAPASPASAPTSQDADAPPQSLKDRLKFFNAAQTKAAPPPPIKPKPATGGLTWSQRQKLRQEQEEKERAERETRGEEPPAPAPPPTAAAAAFASVNATASTTEEKEKSSGLSAADAASSIGQGGSLKERMAALRAGGAFGAPAAAEEKPAPPKPSGKVWQRPAAPPAPEPTSEDEDEKPVQESSAPTSAPEGSAAPEDGQEPAEEDEEEKEKARRAAIAARMAKLGARGPMGMAPAAPPKPARKPTRESIAVSPTDEKAEPTLSTSEGTPDTPQDASAAQAEAVSPPTSVPIAAIPRRAAPPRRRGPTANSTAPAREEPVEGDKRIESIGEDGTIQPPPQVMVANEEAPMPKTDEQLALEADQEEAGRGPRGAEGAAAAGIALAPVERSQGGVETPATEPVVGAVGDAGTDSRGTGAFSDRAGGDIIGHDAPVQEIEDGVEEGGAEKDDIMAEAAAGRLEVKSPVSDLPNEPIAVVPMKPPAPSGPPSEVDNEDEAPPPPPHPPRMTDMFKDEVEMKHEHDAQAAQAEESEEEEDDDSPPPPPRTARLGSEKPLGPRPLPSPVKERPLPPPPLGNPMVPPRDEEEEAREIEGEGDVSDGDDAPPPPPRRESTILPPPVPSGRPPTAPVLTREEHDYEGEEDAPPPPPRRESAVLPPPVPSGRAPQEPILSAEPENEDGDVPPPPPQRKPSMPAPIQTGSTAGSERYAPPASPQVTQSPTQMKTTAAPTSPIATTHQPPQESEEDDEKARRSGIAARMAKLGGIKFGMPPPVFKKPTASSEGPVSPGAREDAPMSPAEEDVPARSPVAEHREPVPVSQEQQADETPEDEAQRRRTTLARLRAGGALGFGMFNHGPESGEEKQDQRGIQQETQEKQPQESAPIATEEEEDVPPPPSARPPVPGGRPSVAIPAPPVDTEDLAAPPPPARPNRQSTSDMPASPIRSPSGRRPPIPAPDRRISAQLSPSRERQSMDQVRDWNTTEEPAVMTMAQHDAPPPHRPMAAPLSPVQTQYIPPQSPTHSRSPSSASRASFKSRMSMDGFSPVARQSSPGQGQLPPTPMQQEVPLSPTTETAPRASTATQGGRPSYDVLTAASKDSGARLARAARAMFDQGKKAYYGDGSPSGFVLIAMDNAHVARPQSGWGQSVYEQEAGSVLRRYDEPRAGDIAAFHDARLKGRKGLQSYEQHVGSVEEPLLGIVVEYEQKNKHKIRVLQVERGVPEEVSYRLDDLKSGKVVIYRAGL